MGIENTESRLFIDGKLVEATGGATYDNVNPATEEVIGPVADASAGRHGAARSRAARRAFDETDWSTNRALRKRCLLQLKEALARHKEELRPQIVAEVGAPIGLTYAIQQDSCIDDMHWDIELHRPLRVGVRARRARVLRHDDEPAGRAASRSASSARSRRGTSRSC